MLDPRAFLINSKTGRVVAATFIEFLSGNSTNPSICFTDSPDSGLQCDNAGAVNYVKNGINLGELGTASNLIGGSDTQIQFNDSGSFGGSADLTWDDTGKELGVGGDINLDDGGTYETTVQVVTPTANRTISFPDATGTVALVAGSSGQVTYNNAGAQAGLTSASIGSTGEINISLAGAASTPPVSFTGSWFTGGTATTTKPQLLIEPTGTTSTAWSTDGTGLGVNAASGFSGRLLDLQTNGTSQMVVQGDGKLGIGTTAPAAQLHVVTSGAGGIRFADGTRAAELGSTGTVCYAGSITSGQDFALYSANAECARIDSSGRLLVGTSSTLSTSSGHIIQAADSTGVKLSLGRSATSVATGLVLASLNGYSNGGGVYEESGNIQIVSDDAHASGDKPGRLVFSTTADGASSPTERMRIDNKGSTGVYAETGSGIRACNQAAAGIIHANFIGRHSASSTTTGTNSFIVWTNGDVVNTNNSYAGISDIKLKENIVDASSQWDDIKALRPVNYNFKPETGQQGHTQLGLIAQEVELVSPGLVSESPDRDEDGNDLGTVTKSVNYSVLYMKAVKALQEAMERIETLEQRLNDAGIA